MASAMQPQPQRIRAIDGDHVESPAGTARIESFYKAIDYTLPSEQNPNLIADVVDRVVLSNAAKVRYDQVHRAARHDPAPRPIERLEPGCLHDATPWIDGIERVIERSMWSSVVNGLLDRANREGLDLYVVGGAVRDIIGGSSPDSVNDIDLAGNVPPSIMLDWMEHFVHANPKLAEHFAKAIKIDMPGSVVHLHYRKHSQLEYLMLRKHFDPATSCWFSGSELAADHQFRDLTLNSLMYDRSTRSIVDPSGTGLSDIQGHVLRPIDVPPVSSAEWGANTLTRCLKSYKKLKGRDPKIGPIIDWYEANEDQITGFQHTNGWRADLYHRTLGVFEIEVNDTSPRDKKAKENIKERSQTIEKFLSFLPPSAAPLLEACRGDGIVDEDHFASSDWLPRGRSLRRLLGDDTLVVGDVLIDLPLGQIHQAAFQIFDRPQPTAFEIDLDGAVASVLGVEDAKGLRAVETDEFGAPLLAD